MSERTPGGPEAPSPALASGDRPPLTSRIVEVFLKGNLTPMLILLSLLGGAVALLTTAREEDPQIVVPVADVLISVPGASAEEVERQVSQRLEKLLYEIDGVEYVYSMSRPDQAVVTVRFFVGEDRERSLVKLYNKISMSQDRIPPQVRGWVVKPVEIDDVPIFAATLYSSDERDDVLRRVAEEIESRLKEVPDTGQTEVIGGRPERVLVEVDPQAAAARGVGWGQIAACLRAADASLPEATLETLGAEVRVAQGAGLRDAAEVRGLVVAVRDDRPVYLRDLATVRTGPAEPADYHRIGFGPAVDSQAVPAALRKVGRDYAAVTIAVAKKKGSNAVQVARALTRRLHEVERDVLPDGVEVYLSRNYGESADDKVNELVEGLAVAVIIVIALIALTLGWREGIVVATAVPITFALTLLVNEWAGYSINRVTLFALTLALGLVVDDPIVDVENIYRHLRMGKRKPFQAVLDAVNEVRPPIILATLAVIVSFLPLFFITGMMGPYMRPMALNVPLSMLMSLVVAFTVTPWISYHMLKGHVPGADQEPPPLQETRTYRVYAAIVQPFLASRVARWALVLVTIGLFGFSGYLAVARKVPLKMLPYDNKTELQVLVDTPEGSTLEATERAAAALAAHLRRLPEVTDVTSFTGRAGPVDFNGLVRHYYLRRHANTAELRVRFVHKKLRVHQSHEIALRMRPDVEKIAKRFGARVKIVELPPGPPVMSTLVAEVYGKPYTPYSQLLDAARVVEARLAREPGVVDVDSTVEARPLRVRFVPDREKMRWSGISERDAAWAVHTAVAGEAVAYLRRPREVNPLPIEIRLAPADRERLGQLDEITVISRDQEAIPLSELGHWERLRAEQTIYRKNLRRVVFVTGEIGDRPPAEVVIDVQADRIFAKNGAADARAWVSGASPRAVAERTFASNGGGISWSVPPDVEVSWKGEGEWKITLDVFRDLGLAFAAACLGIYLLLVHETKSYFMPWILMISIPLTVIGILPGFYLLNQVAASTVGGYQNPVYFTATAMIGMIALSGIAVRNAILLIEFVHNATAEGKPLKQALLESGAVRFRPIFLTAGTAMLAAWPITLDPIFSGLAWALIFGLFVSTSFTLVIIPVIYYMVYGRRHAAAEG